MLSSLDPTPNQIRKLLLEAADACALSIASGDEPFFKKLEWWLADGVFNHEPYGMFRTEAPYKKGDARTIGQYLEQETRHRWDGMETLKDLFAQKVLELTEEWVLKWLPDHVAKMPSPEEWERRWGHEWEEALYLAGLHPELPDAAWEEFLSLSLSTIVERWREHAARVATERALQAARMVSRQGLESAIVERVSDEVAHFKSLTPDVSLVEILEFIAIEKSAISETEIAVYVHSPSITQATCSRTVKALQERFPLPKSWRHPGVCPEAIGQSQE